MNILITGGEASGKSAYAEQIAVEKAAKENLPLFYIATLDRNCGGDTENRIKKHEKMREGKGFFTIEKPKDLDKLALPKENAVVLIEDLANLCANELFCAPTTPVAVDRHDTNTNYASHGKIRTSALSAATLSASVPIFADGVARKIVNELSSVAEKARDVIVVSPDVFSDAPTTTKADGTTEPFSADMHIFLQTLASAANIWAEKCESVVQVVAGIPVAIK